MTARRKADGEGASGSLFCGQIRFPVCTSSRQSKFRGARKQTSPDIATAGPLCKLT